MCSDAAKVSHLLPRIVRLAAPVVEVDRIANECRVVQSAATELQSDEQLSVVDTEPLGSSVLVLAFRRDHLEMVKHADLVKRPSRPAE